MKKPRIPPKINKLEKANGLILEAGRQAKYKHWDILRHIKPPNGLKSEEWWLGIKLNRQATMKSIELVDSKGIPFVYNIPEDVNEQLHLIDVSKIPEPIANPHTRSRYLIHSLIQEAVTSSQLEGAATTREVAKEMLRSGRAPRDQSERMILNNYQTMQQIHAWKDRELDEELVLEIHKHIVKGTLNDSEAEGRLRKHDERVVVELSATGEILYEPPPADQLPKRIKAMCDFANEKTPNFFIHPVIRSIILHFWLAYDHPFVDGNGRTARALFYWSMLRHGYWLFEYISISEMILKAPVQYGMAFLYTETDDNDLTYFIINQADVIQKAMSELERYIEMKAKRASELDALLSKQAHFNHRQQALLAHALRHAGATYTIEAHRSSHDIAYDSARKDLQELHELGLLDMLKRGRAYVFAVPRNFANRLQKVFNDQNSE